ncbi:hypothetical protein PF005_g6440 [Phytophthora fragariae]|uniref:RxLR effector protein n=2 Tax=Phytophthora TaxID=4783 RepID=A0A6A3ZUV1_9STRA|nr:hypothetical protein PF003_g2365 [Phytophthora fragariae]KAE9035650.1 hypothetical protein PR002_g7455 [Phytophthora rubi]KAE8944177.1 hypothetical protein PF009_g6135 [Phytophthora fragariae]KAE9018786.1 hypothetical protein PF011_g6117 [Phytophthora fragariae]KAE9040422.1 hypothetical protein PR001_g7072 [Phytophthora rubi]
MRLPSILLMTTALTLVTSSYAFPSAVDGGTSMLNQVDGADGVGKRSLRTHNDDDAGSKKEARKLDKEASNVKAYGPFVVSSWSIGTSK